MADNFGLKIGVEGEKEFKNALTEINRSFKVLGSEMQLVTSQFDKNDNSVAALTAQNTVLNKEIDAQKEKITTLKAALDNAATSFGENDKRTQNWQIQLNKAEAELNNMERELDSNNQSLEESNNALDSNVSKEKDFKDALSDINQTFKVLGSEMAVVAAQYDKNDKSIEALTARNTVLNKEIESQKNKISVLKDALADSFYSFGENDKRTKEWAVQLNNAKAELIGMERELGDNEKALSDVGDEMQETAKDSGKLGDEVKESGKQADDAGGRFEKFGGVLKGIGAAMGVVVVAAGAAAIKLGKEVVSAYADYEQLVGGVDTLFGEASQTTQKFAENAFKTAGLSANEYMETVTGFSASLIQSLGGDTAKAAQVANTAITDMADNANKMGTDMSSIQNAYQGFAKQNYTMLDNLKLGYGGTKTEMERLLADAEKISGIKYDLSSFSDMTEAIHVIQTEMGITGTTALEATETISGSMAGMGSAVKNLMAGLGNADADIKLLIGNIVEAFKNVVKNITPVIENIVAALPPALDGILQAVGDLLPALLGAVVDLFAQVLNTILSLLPELIPATVEAVMTIVGALIDNLPLLIDAAIQIVVSLIKGIGNTLPKLIPAAVEAVITIVKSLIDSLPMILNAALQLILGLAEGLLTALPKLIAALPTIIMAILDFIIGSIPQIIDAGIKLLVSLVSALPTIIEAIVKAIPEIIGEIINAVIDAIPLIIESGIALLISLVQALPEIITTIVGAIPQIVSGLIDAIVGNIDKIVMAGVQLLVALVQNTPMIIFEVVKAIPTIIAGIVSAILDLVPKIAEAGLNLIKGLWQGISDATDWIMGKIKGFMDGILKNIKKFFGINSPSTVFAGLGKNMGEGLGLGFEEEMDKVARDMQNAIPTNFDVDADVNVNGNMRGKGGTVGSARGGTIVNQYFSINSPKALSEKEIAREFTNLSRKMAMEGA